MRDSQRSRVYRAERTVSAYATADLPGDLASAQRYVTQVNKSPWTIRVLGRTTVAVKTQARAAHASGATRISASPWARERKLILLHELAHNYETLKNGWSTPAHGWRFAAIYLQLVQHWLGVEVADELRRAFKLHRVRYTKPRTRTITPEQKAVLVARLAAYREQKAAISHPLEG